MRRLATLLLVTLCLFTARPAEAQDQIGLGLGLQQFSILPDSELGILTSLTPQLYVPIMITDRLMLEPGIGLFRVYEEDENFAGERVTNKFTFVRIGAGLLFMLTPADRSRLYAGPRIGIMHVSSEFEFAGETSEGSRMDLLFAGVVGGEYFLVPGFSLGGEAGVSYLLFGDEEGDDVPEDTSDGNVISLGTEFRVRWYLD